VSLRPYQPLADVGLLTAPSLFGCCMLSRDLSGNPKEHNAHHPQYHGMAFIEYIYIYLFIHTYTYIYIYSIKIIYKYICIISIRLWNGIINISSASTTPYDEKSPRPGKAKKSHMNIMKPTNHPSRFLVLARSKVSGPCGSTEATYLRRPPAARKNLRLLNQGQGLVDQLAWYPVNL